ncbi:hypothetical protein EBB07_12510 [Paenibacillaceae bacterium]|nr:hypothetical protein EBB07_12510 [Paenibacillaceae bacterium]
MPMPIAPDSEHFNVFRTLQTAQEAAQFGSRLVAQGFAAMRIFLDDFRSFLRTFEDDELSEAYRLIQLAESALPHPGRLSPSWTAVWQEFRAIIHCKAELLACVAPISRSGEWQVLLDNP